VTARVAQLVAATYVSRSGADARLRCGRGRGASVGLCAGVGASSPVTTSLRCRNDRPSRSRRHTTGVSPGRSCSKAASSCGRRSSAPAARSVQTFHHPAAVSSSTCRSGFCSVVAGGGVPVVAGEHRHDDGWRQVGVHLFGALAQFEREIIRDRTVAGLTAARARGRVGGRPSKLSAEQRRQARKIYEERELTVEQIGAVLGVSRSAIYRGTGPHGGAGTPGHARPDRGGRAGGHECGHGGGTGRALPAVRARGRSRWFVVQADPADPEHGPVVGKVLVSPST